MCLLWPSDYPGLSTIIVAIKLSRQVRYLVITPYGHQDLARGITINTNAHDMATLTVAILTMADLPTPQELPHLPRRLLAHPRSLLRRLRLRLQPAGTFPSYHPCSSAPLSHLRLRLQPAGK